LDRKKAPDPFSPHNEEENNDYHYLYNEKKNGDRPYFPEYRIFQNKRDKIELIQPKPYEEVGLNFTIYGKVPKSWLMYDRYGLSINLMYEDGNKFLSISPNIIPSIFSKFKRKIKFCSIINLVFYKEAECAYYGLIVEVSGNNQQSFFFPLMIKGSNTNTDQEYEKEELNKSLSNAIKKIIKDKEDWINYKDELSKIYNSKVNEKEILEGVFEILDQSETNFESFSYSEEDIQEKKLKEKYQEVISQHGHILGGAIGQMAGFDFCVYSNDHDQHFHVIHRGRGIDARFSFPEIKLIDYKNIKAKIGSDEQKKIQNFLNNPVLFKKLENEFLKRKLTV